MPYRSRVMGGFTPHMDSVRFTYYPSTYQDSTSVRGKSGQQKTFSDYVTPNFFRVIEEGRVVNSPMSSVDISHSHAPRSLEIKRNVTTQGTWSGYKCSAGSAIVTALGDSPPLPIGIDISNLETGAITEAYANVSPPDIQGLVAIKELRQTVSMLANPLRGISKALYQGKLGYYQKGDIHKKGRFIADQFLQMKFGILPMIQDIAGIMTALKRAADSQERVTARASSSDSETLSGAEYKSYVDGIMTLKAVVKSQSTNVSVRAGVLYAHQIDLDIALGLTATDIPAAMWEALPWSWVYDYLVNVGDVINALTPKAHTRELAAWCSTKIETQCVTECNYFALSDAAKQSQWSILQSPVGGTSSATYLVKGRSPVGRNRVGLSYKTRISPGHVSNLLAIVLQKLSKLR